MRTSISDTNPYKNIVDVITRSDELFKDFKRNSVYQEILEHVNMETGMRYLDVIKIKYPSILEHVNKFKTNDKIGNAVTYQYGDINISPTTLRYMKVLGELVEMFGSLNDMNIIEIGAGYGGQCKIIHDIFTPKLYTIVDLPQVLKLDEKYLSYFNIENLSLKTWENDFNNYDLVISNYAFTECTRDTQNIYFDKILKNSKNGYLTCNIISNVFNVDSYSREEIIKMIDRSYIINEDPLTHPNNFILIWKK